MSDASWQVIRMVNEFNSDRVRAAYTFDAGPNACIFLEDADLPNLLDQLHQHFAIPAEVLSRLASSGDCGLTHTPDIVRKSSFVVKNIIVSTVGGAPRII
ncbi:unnamed protein product [Nippostrongylus brasiliensis]|uniref:MDD_C domain-containing protein n=1 Tax=Nippostrongylus brasiliensis TaxID=27835 RepID=A0A0N4Y7H9_NIPBR|nr:unnamed protein product [Nippostrongylus brasiliensis]